MLFALDEGLGVQPQHLAQLAQEQRGRVQPDGSLQIGLAQHLGEAAPEFAVHHHVDIGIHQAAHFRQMRAQRHDHVHIGADALDQAADLVQVRRHVEHAIHRPQNVHAGPRTGGARCFGRHPPLGHAEFGEDPGHRPVGRLPLILINGARQKALDVGAHRGHAATDHLGNRSGHDDRWQRRIKRFPGAAHRPLCAVAPQLFLTQTRHHDGQLMRRQAIGVMQDRGHGQVFAAHGAVDHHLQTFDRAKGIDRAPVAPGPVMVLDQHGILREAVRASTHPTRCP